MTSYLIRTDRELNKTYFLQIGDENNLIGSTYTDFMLYKETRDITIEDLVDEKLRTVANIKIGNENNLIEISSKYGLLKSKKVISKVTRDGRYFELDNEINYVKISKTDLLMKPAFAILKERGVTHAFFPEKKSVISSMFCYERDGDISAVFETRGDDESLALCAVPLFLSDRLMKQEYIFDLLGIT